MTSGIYMIKNKINGKIYIGQSLDIERRKKQHFYSLSSNNHPNFHLQNSYNKYGPDNFVFKTIKRNIPKSQLNSLEQRYIKVFKSSNPKFGYNLTNGGESNTPIQAVRSKISKSNLNAKNKTGIKYVSILKHNSYKSGYRFAFKINNYAKYASTLEGLEKKILKDGYKFEIWDIKKYQETIKINDKISKLLLNKRNPFGIKNISKVKTVYRYFKSKNYKKTIIYKAKFYDLLKELINKNIKIEIIDINKVYNILKDEINDLQKINGIIKQIQEVQI